jgi:hypothetical protein
MIGAAFSRVPAVRFANYVGGAVGGVEVAMPGFVGSSAAPLAYRTGCAAIQIIARFSTRRMLHRGLWCEVIPGRLGIFAVVVTGTLGGLHLATRQRHGLKHALVAHFRLLVGLLDRRLALCRLSCFILGVRMTHHALIIPRLGVVVIVQTTRDWMDGRHW